jgi:hypothetical protein
MMDYAEAFERLSVMASKRASWVLDQVDGTTVRTVMQLRAQLLFNKDEAQPDEQFTRCLRWWLE